MDHENHVMFDSPSAQGDAGCRRPFGAGAFERLEIVGTIDDFCGVSSQ
jgi:hypothetical protein